MGTTAKLSASLEDYLEAIFHVVAEKKVARSRDIAKRLGVNRSSVTGALHSLAQKGLVDYEPYEAITLTRSGNAAARDVVRRHEVLRDFLVRILSVEAVEADQAACQMEHAISRPVLERLIQFVEFVEVCPRGGAKWIEGFGRYCQDGNLEACERCITSCLEDVTRRKSDVDRGATTVVSPEESSPGKRGKVEQVKPGKKRQDRATGKPRRGQ